MYPRSLSDDPPRYLKFCGTAGRPAGRVRQVQESEIGRCIAGSVLPRRTTRRRIQQTSPSPPPLLSFVITHAHRAIKERTTILRNFGVLFFPHPFVFQEFRIIFGARRGRTGRGEGADILPGAFPATRPPGSSDVSRNLVDNIFPRVSLFLPANIISP